MGPFRSQHVSLLFDRNCCLDQSELETSLRFLVSSSRRQKQQSESFFIVPLHPTVQFDVVHQLLDLRLKQHTNFCTQHALNCRVLVSLCSLDSSDSFLLWEPLLPMVLHLHSFPFPHLHGALQLVHCHHQLGPDPCSEFSLDLRTHSSAITGRDAETI